MEEVLTLWADTVRQSPLDEHPKLWVGYWHQNQYLSGIKSTVYSKEQTWLLATPFLMCGDVTGMWMLVDNADLFAAHIRMSSDCVRVDEFRVGYSISDGGRYVFDEPVVAPVLGGMRTVLGFVADHRCRSTPLHSFEEAFTAAFMMAEKNAEKEGTWKQL